MSYVADYDNFGEVDWSEIDPEYYKKIQKEKCDNFGEVDWSENYKIQEEKEEIEEEEIPDNLLDFIITKMTKRSNHFKDDDEAEEIQEIGDEYVIGGDDYSYDSYDSYDSYVESKNQSNTWKNPKNPMNPMNPRNPKNPKNPITKIDDYDPISVPLWKINNQKKFVIKGLVQSGKTEYIICMMIYMLLKGKSVVVVFRRIDDDRVQFSKRFVEFKNKYEDKFPILNNIPVIDNIHERGNSISDSPRIFLVLDDPSNIKKVNKILLQSKERYATIFDEADLVDSGKGYKSKHYETLKMCSSKIFWVSATIMDMLAKEEGISGDNIIFLSPSDRKNYKGILNNKIDMKTIPEGKFVSDSSDDVFSLNPYFETFLDEYKQKDGFPNHPRICLVNLTECIDVMLKTQKSISHKHQEYTVIVYNSCGLTITKGKKTFKGRDVGIDNISSILQHLKDVKDGDEKHSHIIILSGKLAGRGISFVSNDYKWHLTDEYLVVSSNTDEPELIQKVRLQGIYKDNIPLTLYVSENTRKDLIKASIRIEELSVACKDNTDKECKKLLSEIPVMKEKFTKRDMTKSITIKMNKVNYDVGWSTKIYKGNDDIPDDVLNTYGIFINDEDKKYREDEDEDEDEDEYEEEDDEEEEEGEYKRLINKMFKKWREDKTSKISKFLHNFDPNKSYTEKEIKELCTQTGIVLKHLMVTKYKSQSKGYGKIIKKYGNKYGMRVSLISEFIKVFS